MTEEDSIHNKLFQKYCIGNICISIQFEEQKSKDDYKYKKFICKKKPDVHIECVNMSLHPSFFEDLEPVFDSQGRWSYFRKNGNNVFFIKGPHEKLFESENVVIFDSKFVNGKFIYTNQTIDTIDYFPIDYPFGEVLYINLLAQRRGLLIHACGIDDGGKGYLFAGNSGDGKTTIAKLFKGSGMILNDDRIIIREKNNSFSIYSTPWHGDYKEVEVKKVKLDKIFIINKSTTNSIERINTGSSVQKLLTRCFPSLWDKKGMEFTLEFLADLANSIPCYSLEFLDDKEIVNFIRCVS